MRLVSTKIKTTQNEKVSCDIVFFEYTTLDVLRL